MQDNPCETDGTCDHEVRREGVPSFEEWQSQQDVQVETGQVEPAPPPLAELPATGTEGWLLAGAIVLVGAGTGLLARFGKGTR